MIFCKELNKEFADKSEMFSALKINKEKIIGLKKASIKNSDPVSYVIKSTEVEKGAPVEGEVVGIGSYVYAVINTTNYYDSCGDVHLDGIWDNSLKDQKGKLYYVINHELKLGSVIAYPNDVEASVQTLKWSELGLDYTGKTQALIYKAKLTEATNKDALSAIVTKQDIQNSVRMGYISMILCIDDSSEDYKQEKANFDKYLAIIANKQDAEDAGYFWAIAEAKIVKEGSAVLFGANDATPILYTDPADAGQKQKEQVSPEDSSPKFSVNKLLSIF
jgi:hypothetical protein